MAVGGTYMPAPPSGWEQWKPGTMVYPVPAALITCGEFDETVGTSNLITISWIGTVCTNPPMLSISVRPERHSYGMIMATKEFTVNLTTEAMAKATDYCGVTTGAETDKWKDTGLTPLAGVINRCPIIAEAPLAIECKVNRVIPLGSHDLFIADVINVLARKDFLNPETGAFDLASSGLIAYCHGNYFNLGENLGHFGYSVRKKP